MTFPCACCDAEWSPLDFPLGIHAPRKDTWVGTRHRWRDVDEVRVFGYDGRGYQLLVTMTPEEAGL